MKLLLYCTKKKPDLTITTNYFGKANGKIVAECDYEVEEIKYKDNNYYFEDKHAFHTLRESCLGICELDNYLKGNNGYAIHIKHLHIFDKPKELDYYSKRIGQDFQVLGKAPQNMMHCVDLKQTIIQDYILISIRPEWLCKILNGEKTIEIRKKVLKGMI